MNGNDHTTKVARSLYRSLTRRLSKESRAQKAEILIDELKKCSRLFWKKYKGNDNKCPLMNVEEWAKYFASTFQSSEQVHPEPPHVSQTDVEAAKILNIPITESEVYAELLKLKRNKAV